MVSSALPRTASNSSRSGRDVPRAGQRRSANVIGAWWAVAIVLHSPTARAAPDYTVLPPARKTPRSVGPSALDPPQGAPADVAPAETFRPVDPIDRGIGAILGLAERRGVGGDVQDATAGRD